MSLRLTLALAVLPAMLWVTEAQTFPSTVPPRVVKTTVPEYTKEAREAGIEGNVILSFTVEIDGTPSGITVTKGLGRGLDEKATECLSHWRFAPATNGGTAVAARATAQISFRLLSPH